MGILQGHLYGRTRTVQVKSGMSIDSHLESCVLVQTASPYSPGKYVNWNLSLSCTLAMGILQGHLYGRTRTVQVKSGMSIDSHPESCVLVQTASPYSPGKYVNWNLSFSMEIAMVILQGHLYGRTRTVQVKSGMSIDSHPESCVLVQTASPHSPGKYVNWNLSFSMEILYISYGNSSRSPVRPYKNCTGQLWYVH